MSNQGFKAALTLRLVRDILLVALGTSLFIGSGPTESPIWLPLVIVLAGVFVLTPKNTNSTIAGLVLIGLGSYMLLREAGIIADPWLRYILAGFCVFTGAINILLIATGKEVGLNRTSKKPKHEQDTREN